MKILVTGGGGFIGGALLKRLVNEGHHVSSFSRGDYPELRNIGVETFSADLQDYTSVLKATIGVDMVFHTAALAGFWGPYRDYHNANVVGTENVIRACIRNGVDRLVYTGSASVVFDGNNIEGLNEALPYPARPISAYTATKALAEQKILEANSQGLKTLSLRPHLVWGPGDRHILPRLAEQAQSGKLRIIGDGYNIVDTTYIDNVVSAHLCAAKALEDKPPASGRAYFITNGEPVPLWKLANELITIKGINPIEKSVSRRTAMTMALILSSFHRLFMKNREPRLTPFLVHELTASHWFDITSAKTILGYKPEVSIKDGLEKLKSQSQ